MKAEAPLLHSIESYKRWGALAVAKRIETLLARKYGSKDCVHQRPNSIVLESIFAACNEDPSKKKSQEVS